MATVLDGKMLPDNQEGETKEYETQVAETVEDATQVPLAQGTPVPEDPAAVTPSLNGSVPGTPVNDPDIEKIPVAVEQMSWKHLQMSEKGHQYCDKCRMVVDVRSPHVIKKKITQEPSMQTMPQCGDIVIPQLGHGQAGRLQGFATGGGWGTYKIRFLTLYIFMQYICVESICFSKEVNIYHDFGHHGLYSKHQRSSPCSLSQ